MIIAKFAKLKGIKYLCIFNAVKAFTRLHDQAYYLYFKCLIDTYSDLSVF